MHSKGNSFLILSFLVLLFSGTSLSEPISVRDQVVDGRLITEWGSFDSLGFRWHRDFSDETLFYAGATVLDSLKFLKATPDSAIAGDLYLLLGVPPEADWEGLMKELPSSYGEIQSFNWVSRDDTKSGRSFKSLEHDFPTAVRLTFLPDLSELRFRILVSKRE